MTDKSQNETERAENTLPIVDKPLSEPIFDRRKLLEMSASCIDEIYNRVDGDRFRVREGDKERIAYLKLLKDYISLHTSLLEASGAPKFDGVPKVWVDKRTPEEKEEDRLLFEASEKKYRQSIRDCLYGT